MFEAYKKKEANVFHQIAMSCRHCNVRRLSQEQLDLCKSEFPKLYHHLFGEKLDFDFLAQDKGKLKIRIKERGLKCDGKLGADYRIDVFAK